jgi:hypothetical protein
MSLDALMHKTTHAAYEVNELRARPGTVSENQIHRLMDSLTEAHQKWRELRVIRNRSENELAAEFYGKVNKSSSTRQFNTPDLQSGMNQSCFLDYSPVQISAPVFASRLNNWRAIRIHLGLIRDPMWGLYDGSRFVCAVDLCRTHAALGSERNLLGAEKSVGLYLAGVVFGGPYMYAVRPLLIEVSKAMIERVAVGFGTVGGTWSISPSCTYI